AYSLPPHIATPLSPRSLSFFLRIPPPPSAPLFPYTTLFRSQGGHAVGPGLPDDRLLWCRCMGLHAHLTLDQLLHPRYPADRGARSEEHTSELQSRFDLVCRLLLEKKNTLTITRSSSPLLSCT